MLTGSMCAADVPVDEARLGRAVETMRRAAFVGITDEWNDSICLFHAMYGITLSAHYFMNVRDSSKLVEGNYTSKDAERVLTPSDDPYDWQLFLAVKSLFRERQRLYGIPIYESP